MPELPEVEGVLRELRPGLTGRRIERVQLLREGALEGCLADDFRRKLQGAVFATAERLGKYLIFGLERAGAERTEARFLIIHLRMTGRLNLVPVAESLDRHTSLTLFLDRGVALRFDDPRRFGRVWLTDDPAKVVGKLGPDALTIDFDPFVRRIKATDRQLKPLLLDQPFLAGIGNIYADEILFRCGLHPLSSSGALSADDLARLHAAVRAVLTEAVSAGGANIDGVFAAGGYRVAVYGRQGHPCPVCGSGVVKSRVGQRGTHFCPACQVLREKPH